MAIGRTPRAAGGAADTSVVDLNDTVALSSSVPPARTPVPAPSPAHSLRSERSQQHLQNNPGTFQDRVSLDFRAGPIEAGIDQLS